MPGVLFSVMAGLVLVYALFARRIAPTNITAPMLSLLAGAVVFGIRGTFDVEAEAVHLIAEIALVIVLFHDASTVNLQQLRADPWVPVRLLLIGFPLALIVTFGANLLFLPALGIAGAVLLAAAVTPTDAGLGAPTVLNPVVPVRVRRSLNVESGLNDGLATPIVLLALAALAAEEGVESPTILQVGIVPVSIALALALAVGLGVAWLLDRSAGGRMSSRRGRAIAVFMVPLLIFGLAEVLGGNAFIAAFVGGFVFGAASSVIHDDHNSTELLDVAADLLGFGVWFLAGGLLLQVVSNGIKWQWVVLAILILTVLRVVPVWLCLLGTGFRAPTIGFIGWFGPRGLATIVFGLLALEELGPGDPIMVEVAGVIACVVVLSVVAHGFSAGPLAVAYGNWVHRNHPPIEREPGHEPRRRTRGMVGT